MTENQVAAGKSDLLFDRIWRRSVFVIPFLLLSSGIAFLIFKVIYEKFGSNFFDEISGLITIGGIICGIAFIISTVVGYNYRDRQLGCTLSFLIPIVLSLEVIIQFGQPLDFFLIIMYLALVLGFFDYIFVDYVMRPLINTNNLKKEDVLCIQIFSPFAKAAGLVDEVLKTYLNITKVKKLIADNEKHWRFRFPSITYLYERSDNDNSVYLAFLNFTQRANVLYRSERDKKDLNVLKEIIAGYLRSEDINCKSVQNSDISSDILEVVRRNYKGIMDITVLKELINNLKSYKYVIIIVFLIALMVYLGRQSITKLSELYPWAFITMISIISALIGAFAKDLIQFLRSSGKK